MTFNDLGITPSILKALEHAKYKHPTPIQEQAIPPVLAGRDLLGVAQTGTGKTAAFAVPTLQRLMRPEGQGNDHRAPRRIRSLILTPTRELALQIHDSFSTYGRHTDLRSCVIFGGVSQRTQEQELRRGIDILVATPGRLADLMNQHLIDLQHVEILTLDEADRMLDMGFIHEVKRIIAKTPAKRQTLFFSATMPAEIVALSSSMLTSPVKVSITPDEPTVDKIQQSVYHVDKVNKRNLLVHLLKDPAIDSVLVFTRTKHGADRVVRELSRDNIYAQAIHGNKSQNARQQALGNFKNKTTRVLVATDIAARGIDINELSHVINYDLPEIPESYVHRIGRTGRAGRGGIAISFCDFEEKKLLTAIEKLCVKTIPVVDGHPFPLLITTILPKPVQQGRNSSPRNPARPRQQPAQHERQNNASQQREQPRGPQQRELQKNRPQQRELQNNGPQLRRPSTRLA